MRERTDMGTNGRPPAAAWPGVGKTTEATKSTKEQLTAVFDRLRLYERRRGGVYRVALGLPFLSIQIEIAIGIGIGIEIVYTVAMTEQGHGSSIPIAIAIPISMVPAFLCVSASPRLCARPAFQACTLTGWLPATPAASIRLPHSVNGRRPFTAARGNLNRRPLASRRMIGYVGLRGLRPQRVKRSPFHSNPSP